MGSKTYAHQICACFAAALIVPREAPLPPLTQLRDGNPPLLPVRIAVVEEETVLMRPIGVEEWAKSRRCRWKCVLPNFGTLAFFGLQKDFPDVVDGLAAIYCHQVITGEVEPSYKVESSEEDLIGYSVWVRSLVSPTDVIEFLVDESERTLSQ